ncbi:MAG: tRNA (5-methylaminomethyl-2-thiouridine)(34)-methyltransferase MnmD [Fimbriimonadaceae bacterium]|nr:tRNA (5-methylaminomethyl-2-thiouridine)(34)-methyltransferase MnmD [Chitinophagales bacterium]
MFPEIRITKDGSQTIYVPALNEHYHSIHGAYTESMHVFIQNGFIKKLGENIKKIKILEIGLGTGLNALLTLEHAINKQISYTALEPFPLVPDIIHQLHFEKIADCRHFKTIHYSEFNTEISLAENFTFTKIDQRLEDVIFHEKFDLIYFDAFGPKAQPDIWCLQNFEKLYIATNENGILVTYCSKGDVRRNMIAAGYFVEKLPGPPGKREMLRATKK